MLPRVATEEQERKIHSKYKYRAENFNSTSDFNTNDNWRSLSFSILYSQKHNKIIHLILIYTSGEKKSFL